MHAIGFQGMGASAIEQYSLNIQLVKEKVQIKIQITCLSVARHHLLLCYECQVAIAILIMNSAASFEYEISESLIINEKRIPLSGPITTVVGGDATPRASGSSDSCAGSEK